MTVQKNEIFFSRISPLLKGKGAGLSQKKKSSFFLTRKRILKTSAASQKIVPFLVHTGTKKTLGLLKKKKKSSGFSEKNFQDFSNLSLFFVFFLHGKMAEWLLRQFGRLVPFGSVGSIPTLSGKTEKEFLQEGISS